jgi:opacity protein-like surface antigen
LTRLPASASVSLILAFLLACRLKAQRRRLVKKFILLTVFIAVKAAVFAQIPLPEFTLSAGIGNFFTAAFGGGVEGTASFLGQNYSAKIPLTTAGGGVFAFFDATFAELSVAYNSGGATVKPETTLPAAASAFLSGLLDEYELSYKALDLSLMAKYPFSLGAFTLFPLLGLDYLLVLSVKDEHGIGLDNPGDYNSFSFQLGLGADYAFGRALYVRGEFLYSFQLPGRFERDGKAALEEFIPGFKVKNPLGHGPGIRIAAGYRF